MRDLGTSAAMTLAPRDGEAAVNRYRNALAVVLRILSAIRHRIVAAFDLLAVAIRAEVWQGRSARRWYGEVDSVRAQAVAAIDESHADCGRAWARQPELVPADDPRSRYPDPPPDPRPIG